MNVQSNTLWEKYQQNSRFMNAMSVMNVFLSSARIFQYIFVMTAYLYENSHDTHITWDKGNYQVG